MSNTGSDGDPPARATRARPVESVTQHVYEYCMPAGKNVHGLERGGRVVAGTAIGAFGILGVVTAEQPVLGVTMSILLLGMTAYLLATAKTQKCPVKHVAVRQFSG